jgi:uncharacterized protein YndB with AHSA1/START domain
VTHPNLDPVTFLQLRRTIPAARLRVFRAWTDPAQLKKWFAVADGFTTPIADVDLRIGGRYRLGMQPPGNDPVLIVAGIYREIIPPEKLVFTWRWESSDEDEPETLVTVNFIERGNVTEVVLHHERFTSEALRDKHREGWAGCMDHLEHLFAAH